MFFFYFNGIKQHLKQAMFVLLYIISTQRFGAQLVTSALSSIPFYYAAE